MDRQVRCCIAGGGPAGMMLGFLLARAGFDVVVLEKHADFFRDFRGDTIHPSTLQVMHELGLIERFLALPHQEIETATARIGDLTVTLADFRHLPTACKFIAMMPQWEFLNFLASEARAYPSFHLELNAQATDLLFDGQRVAGVRATTPRGDREIRADLVVAADGRGSLLRERARLPVSELGAPMDVLWLRLSRRPSDARDLLGTVDAGKIFVMFDRGDYWQCAFVIPKGGIDAVRARGLPAFRGDLAALVPFLGDRVGELRDWSEVKLLTVRVDRLRRWYRPGFVCIGDAAHAMSPIGGVGVNLAVQDAVAAANILTAALHRGRIGVRPLRALQRRRALPTAVTQRFQLFIQNAVIGRVLTSTTSLRAPRALGLFNRFPFLRRLPAYFVGLGVRPEHVRGPDAEAARETSP
ncbi:MAG: FAD-dependent oxidoreductase [Candidatus Velthaea sp.]